MAEAWVIRFRRLFKVFLSIKTQIAHDKTVDYLALATKFAFKARDLKS